MTRTLDREYSQTDRDDTVMIHLVVDRLLQLLERRDDYFLYLCRSDVGGYEGGEGP